MFKLLNVNNSIVALDGEKYFKGKATDGKGGKEVDWLIKHIVDSEHTSTLEHLTYTFAVEGVSRALLTQLTRHHVGFSYSVQSQRYVSMGSDDKIGGFDYVVPETVKAKGEQVVKAYNKMMYKLQSDYDLLRTLVIPAEDARSVLANAATTNLVLTVNLRVLLDFYNKRRKGKGAQAEIAELVEQLRQEVVKVEKWVDEFFGSGK
ncbi:FAD-dependent thymidylate synthase [Bacillus cereus]|uniref:FAD-dependent thymidylate synthase n=1 Tax=Bacillus cereus TaxID=1396 RepID=UPI00211D4ADC|nr:FAD-dependent thymidylate synthase [Bacillus cereus]